MTEEIKKDDQFKTRLYPEDIEQFRETAKELGITQKDLFSQYRLAFSRLKLEAEHKAYSTDLRTLRTKTDEIMSMFEALVIRTGEEITKARIDENEYNKVVAKSYEAQQLHAEELEEKLKEIKQLEQDKVSLHKQLLDKTKLLQNVEDKIQQLMGYEEENKKLEREVYGFQSQCENLEKHFKDELQRKDKAIKELQNEVILVRSAREKDELTHRSEILQVKQELQEKYEEKVEKFQLKYEESLQDYRSVLEEKTKFELQVSDLKSKYTKEIEKLKKEIQDLKERDKK